MTSQQPEPLGAIDKAASTAIEQALAIHKATTVASELAGELQAGKAAADELSTLVARVSGDAIAEIDRVIDELKSLRDHLAAEDGRIRQVIAGYADMSQATMGCVSVIADSLSEFRRAGRDPSAPAVSEGAPKSEAAG